MAAYLVVTASGAAVLMLELVGTRLLGPYYGVSLFLWSALITVTLTSLSLGYWAGGELADRAARRHEQGALGLAPVGTLMLVAALWLLLVPWLRRPVVEALDPLGLRTGLLLSATILFALPLTLLGMVTPYCIRCHTQSLSEVGRATGRLFAVSTLASVMAALLTGFVLIPQVGVTRLILSIALLLMAGAAVAWLADRRRSPAGPALLVVGLALSAAVAARGAERAPELVASVPSGYGDIRVWERDGWRHLIIDGGAHSVVEVRTMQTTYDYVKVLSLSAGLFERPGRLTLLGLGGGSLARLYAGLGWKVEVAELDPVIPQVARRYFGLTERDASIHVVDARRYLRESHQRSDLMLVDAFGSSYIPFHLVTRESFALMASHLEPRGVLGLHMEALGPEDPLLASVYWTLKEEFPEVVAMPASVFEGGLTNFVLLAARRPLNLEDLPMDPVQQKAFQSRVVPPREKALILTDDLNPVDVWAESVNQVERKVLHDYYGRDSLTW